MSQITEEFNMKNEMENWLKFDSHILDLNHVTNYTKMKSYILVIQPKVFAHFIWETAQAYGHNTAFCIFCGCKVQTGAVDKMLGTAFLRQAHILN